MLSITILLLYVASTFGAVVSTATRSDIIPLDVPEPDNITLTRWDDETIYKYIPSFCKSTKVDTYSLLRLHSLNFQAKAVGLMLQMPKDQFREVRDFAPITYLC